MRACVRVFVLAGCWRRGERELGVAAIPTTTNAALNFFPTRRIFRFATNNKTGGAERIFSLLYSLASLLPSSLHSLSCSLCSTWWRALSRSRRVSLLVSQLYPHAPSR